MDTGLYTTCHLQHARSIADNTGSLHRFRYREAIAIFQVAQIHNSAKGYALPRTLNYFSKFQQHMFGLLAVVLCYYNGFYAICQTLF
jgi:hypothetical protein